METTLHRQLKALYGPARGGRAEVVVGDFRIDAIVPDGTLIEVQTGALGPLRAKLGRLLQAHRVRVVKPVVVSRRIVKRARRDGPDLSARLSPRRGTSVDAFEDLIGLARLFPHPNLRIDVLPVAIEEVRVPRRRRPGYAVVDRRLAEVRGLTALARAEDLWSLLPDDLPAPFTTADLAARLGRPIFFAQRVAYCLRLSGAAVVIGKQRRFSVYARAGAKRRPDRRGGPG
jgi:hypothetical protein